MLKNKQTNPPTFYIILNSEIKFVVFTNTDLNFKKVFIVFDRHQLLGINMVINTAQLVEMGSQKSLLSPGALLQLHQAPIQMH